MACNESMVIMARLNNRGDLAGYEALIILVLLGVSGYVTYLWAHKPSEANVYATGSRPVIYEVKPSFGGCASLGVERMRDERIANTQIKRN